jgi:multicomponent Na+:H+ antiporter subunit E
MKQIVMFILAFIVWCLLVWPYDYSPDGTATLDGQSIIVGVVAAVLVTVLFGGMFSEDPLKFFNPSRYLWLIIYLPVFAYYCLKANLQVVYLVLHPQMPIEPGIVKVRTKLRNPAAITALSNSITLTPGTLTVDADEQGVLYVHWLKVESKDEQEATEKIVGKFEYFLERIFE